MSDARIRKPHDQLLRRLIKEDIVEMRGFKLMPSALYFLREKKNMPYVGIKRRGHNHFTLYKKSDFGVKKELSKRTIFSVL